MASTRRPLSVARPRVVGELPQLLGLPSVFDWRRGRRGAAAARL